VSVEAEMVKKTVLITGATGFLGSHLARKFVNEGYEVVILKRSFSDMQRIADITDKVVSYDIDKIDIAAPFKKHRITSVIHAATTYGKNQEEKSEIVDINLYFPLRLLEASIRNRVDVFINTDTFFDPGYKYLQAYSLSKSQFVEWLKIADSKIKIFNMKLEHIYGEMDSPLKFIPAIVIQLVERSKEIKMRKGDRKRDFIYVSDVIDAYAAVVAKRVKFKQGFHEYGVGTGRSVSIKDVVRLVKELTGNKKTFLNLEALPLEKSEMADSAADTRSIRKELGWRPKVSLPKGLQRVIAWHRNNLKIQMVPSDD